jgi:hypothetical protein
MQADADGEIAKGRLSIGRAKDAAGRREHPYLVTLPVATCLKAQEPEDSVERAGKIHIYSSNQKVHALIGKFVGKTVLVRGRPFAAHTAHHHAPIVMDITEIDTH